MFLRSGHLLLLLLLRLLFLLLCVFYKMTYGNEVLPRHFPVHFYDYFALFSASLFSVLTYYLFLFVLINTRFVGIISRFIRNLKKVQERGRVKKVLIYACSTQISKINILIRSFSAWRMANEMGDVFGMKPLLIPS